MGRLDYYGKAWLPARDLVVKALNDRTQYHPSGKIIVFEQFAPWKVHLHLVPSISLSPFVTLLTLRSCRQEHLFELEAEQSITSSSTPSQPIYVLYPDETAGNWRIQAVPVSPESFESRKSLPEVWRGVRDDELSKVTGIEGGIFVHASGFIGGNKTKEGAMEMARKALEM